MFFDAEHVAWMKEHGHAADCPEHWNNTQVGLPNFQCGDTMIDWYKYIGRDTRVYRNLSRREIDEMFKKCFSSLDRAEPSSEAK